MNINNIKFEYLQYPQALTYLCVHFELILTPDPATIKATGHFELIPFLTFSNSASVKVVSAFTSKSI